MRVTLNLCMIRQNKLNSRYILKLYKVFYIMTNPREIIEEFKNMPDRPRIEKSALVYQYLYKKHFDIELPLDNIIKNHHNDMGLIGPGHGCITKICERFCNNNVCRNHSVMHDAFGRFYSDTKKDRGYCYALKKAPRFIRRSPLCGQISGLIYCMFVSF